MSLKIDNLSAIIITKNEEKNIDRCLESMKDLVNEIIIVDSGSDDKTLEIAKKYTTKLFFRQWTNDYAAQKNYAISKAAGDWILTIDADELLSPELKTEIRNFFSSGEEKKYDGMYILRKNIIFGQWIKYGDCWLDYQIKFFRRGNYFQRAIHEKVVVSGACGRFKSPLIHVIKCQNIRQFIQVYQKYINIEVGVLKEAGQKAYLWQIVFYPIAKFCKVYFLKRGFLDGRLGFVLACLVAYYSFLKRFKFYQYSHTK